MSSKINDHINLLSPVTVLTLPANKNPICRNIVSEASVKVIQPSSLFTSAHSQSSRHTATEFESVIYGKSTLNF